MLASFRSRISHYFLLISSEKRIRTYIGLLQNEFFSSGTFLLLFSVKTLLSLLVLSLKFDNQLRALGCLTLSSISQKDLTEPWEIPSGVCVPTHSLKF